jgi:tetratricopeptide (TPR) repeat protein
LKRPLVLALLGIAFLGQTAYFGRLTWGAFLELRGQRAYFRNDLPGAWDLTQRALDCGGDRARLETRLVEILLMGFNQGDVGVRIDMPLDAGPAAEETRRLLQRRIDDAPHLASLWSYAANLAFHLAHEERSSHPIDLSTLSENPMENLLPEDRLGVTALEKAANLEPNNYLYDALLVEQFLEYGSVEEASRCCRRAVAAYPRFDGHTYLSRFDLPKPVVDAAVQGFEDALRSTSLVARVEIMRDAARLLARHGRDEEVIPYLVDANRLDPNYYDARIDLAMTRLRLGQWVEAGQDLEAAARLLPDDPTPHFHLARVRRHAGDDEGAIEELRRARALGASETKVFLAMGESFESLNRMKEAENQFVAATNLHPGDGDAWSALYSFAMRHDDARTAARACARLAHLKDVDVRILQRCAAQAGGA